MKLTKNFFTQPWWLAHETASISTLLDAEEVLPSSATMFNKFSKFGKSFEVSLLSIFSSGLDHSRFSF